jgi:acyl-CoA thioester hydrolase
MHEVFENTVRFEETDAQGIVFYGNYATFQDETFSAFMDAVGYPYEEIEERGWDVHVVNLELNYRQSAAFRDHLHNSMRVAAIRGSSIELAYECRDEDGDMVVEGSVTHVAVDSETGSTTRVPDAFREAVVEFQDEPPDPV